MHLAIFFVVPNLQVGSAALGSSTLPSAHWTTNDAAAGVPTLEYPAFAEKSKVATTIVAVDSNAPLAFAVKHLNAENMVFAVYETLKLFDKVSEMVIGIALDDNVGQGFEMGV